MPYIKQYHTTGLSWNPRGEAAKAPAASAPAAAKPAAAAAAPAAAATAGAPAKPPQLFAELNKGGAITSGLKKVARSETNKDKKISGKVEDKATTAVASKPVKPARCELVGNKWTVEYQHHPGAPVVIKVRPLFTRTKRS